MENQDKAVHIGAKMKPVFEVWYTKQAYYVPYSLRNFSHMPFEFQQGVYLAFLREQGVEAKVHTNTSGKNAFGEIELKYPWFPCYDSFETSYCSDHNTALAAAITAGFTHLETHFEKKLSDF